MKTLGTATIAPSPQGFLPQIGDSGWAPLRVAVSPTDPIVTVRGSRSDGTLYNAAALQSVPAVTVRMPQGVQPPTGDGQGNFDGHVTLFDAGKSRRRMFYGMVRHDDGTYSADLYAEQPYAGTLCADAAHPNNSNTATGIDAAAGVLTFADLVPGAIINHALAITLAAWSLSRSFVPPATAMDSDVSQNTGAIHYGSRLMLPDDHPATGIELLDRIQTCLKTYGAIVRDRNVATPFAIFSEYGTPGQSFPADALMAIAGALRPNVG